jgi:hypothetical protein
LIFSLVSYKKYLTNPTKGHTLSQMERLSTQGRAAVLRCLIEGVSIRATFRLTGVAKNTIIKLLEEAGEACAVYQGARFRNLPCKVIQSDEVWPFVGCRDKSKKEAIGPHPGDVWKRTSSRHGVSGTARPVRQWISATISAGGCLVGSKLQAMDIRPIRLP